MEINGKSIITSGYLFTTVINAEIFYQFNQNKK